MVNYAYDFSQSETEKYFKWIISSYPTSAHVGNEMIDSQLGAKRRVGYNHVTSASGKISLLKTPTIQYITTKDGVRPETSAFHLPHVY